MRVLLLFIDSLFVIWRGSVKVTVGETVQYHQKRLSLSLLGTHPNSAMLNSRVMVSQTPTAEGGPVLPVWRSIEPKTLISTRVTAYVFFFVCIFEA